MKAFHASRAAGRLKAVFSPCAILLPLVLPLAAQGPARGAERTVEFGGRTWKVREGAGGPGPNSWSNSKESVHVDAQGRLHLKIRRINGAWHAAEVWTEKSLGYGDYVFELSNDVEKFDRNVVAGFFTYLDDNHEIDIEFSRWGHPSEPPAQYVVQPGSRPGNVRRFSLGLTREFSTHRFLWREKSVLFQSHHGHHAALAVPARSLLIQEWRCVSPDIPQAGAERFHINLWLDQGKPPADGRDVELIVASFTWNKGR